MERPESEARDPITRSRAARWLLLAAAALLLAARDPGLLRTPRFWAEEGKLYFAYAFGHSWGEVLRTSHLDYYQIGPMALTKAAADLLPLEQAPWLTTLGALLIQLLAPALILWSRSPLWRRPLVRCAAVLATIVTPLNAEIWLTSLHVQFHLLVAAFVLLIDDADAAYGRVGRWARLAVLALAGLNGAVSAFLVPAWLAKAWTARRREVTVSAAVAVACAAFQAGWLLSAASQETVVAEHLGRRFGGFDVPATITALWVRCLALPLLGRDLTEDLAVGLREGIQTGGPRAWGLAGLLLASAVAALWPLVRRGPRAIILAAFVPAALLSAAGSLGDKVEYISAEHGTRYFFGPVVMLVVLVLANIRPAPGGRPGWRGPVCALAVLVVLAQGIRDYVRPLPAFASWSRWPDEVAAWRANPRHQLRIWPEGWTLSLAGEEMFAGSVRDLGGDRAPDGTAGPRLDADPPRPGRTWHLRLSEAPPGASGVVLRSEATSFAPVPVPGLPGGLSFVPLDARTTEVARVNVGSDGTWGLEQAVPDTRWMPGATMRWQVVLHTPALAVSNALEVTVGY